MPARRAGQHYDRAFAARSFVGAAVAVRAGVGGAVRVRLRQRVARGEPCRASQAKLDGWSRRDRRDDLHRLPPPPPPSEAGMVSSIFLASVSRSTASAGTASSILLASISRSAASAATISVTQGSPSPPLSFCARMAAAQVRMRLVKSVIGSPSCDRTRHRSGQDSMALLSGPACHNTGTAVVRRTDSGRTCA